jgi:hypothetical protein
MKSSHARRLLSKKAGLRDGIVKAPHIDLVNIMELQSTVTKSWHGCPKKLGNKMNTIWLFNIAMENHHAFFRTVSYL